jgi:demethylmenaquinone methyltransferase/2-methoxy-6-polyprenyl-1,4-benzoquinol methylase
MPSTLSATESVDKAAPRVRRMFAQIANRYDLLNHLLSLNVDRYWRWRTVRLVPPAGDAPILDVCTGTGDLALAYRRRTENARVIGVDFCPEMLRIARRKSDRQSPASSVAFAEADALRLPFLDDAFQIVCVAFGLRNVEDTDAGLRELVRVCRPGGRVAVLEFSTPTFWPVRMLYGFYFRHLLPRIGQWLARNDHDAYEYLPNSVGEFPSGRRLAERMELAGLESIVLYLFTFGIVTLYVGQKRSPAMN